MAEIEGSGSRCPPGPLPSHGRGHRFNPCRAHHHFRRKAGNIIPPKPTNRNLSEANGTFARLDPCKIRALADPNLGNVMGLVNIGLFAVITASKPREQRMNHTRTRENVLPRYSHAVNSLLAAITVTRSRLIFTRE
jgi:hypothetical protein